MTRVRPWLVVIFLVVTNVGCAHKVITFKADGAKTKATVSLVSASKPDDDGTQLGVTPVTVDVGTLSGKLVKIAADGKRPVFWLVAEAAGDTTEATVRLPDEAACMPGGQTAGASGKAATNHVLRVLMRAYQALSGRRFQDARDLADQAAVLDPELAAPLVIKGLAYYQEGKAEAARAALTKAQTLDADDADIGTLLKAIR